MKFYRNGDKCEYTGKTVTLHGGLFYEFIWLEGVRKGQTGVTQCAPKE